MGREGGEGDGSGRGRGGEGKRKRGRVSNGRIRIKRKIKVNAFRRPLCRRLVGMNGSIEVIIKAFFERWRFLERLSNGGSGLSVF